MENDQLGTNSAHTIDLKAAGWTEPPTSMLIYRLLSRSRTLKKQKETAGVLRIQTVRMSHLNSVRQFAVDCSFRIITTLTKRHELVRRQIIRIWDIS